MMNKKKVLIVTEAVSYGGNNMVAMNIEKHLNKDKFERTYCVRRDSIGAFEQEIIDRGVKVIHVPDSELGYIRSFKFYRNLFKSEHFDIVHSHLPFVSGLVFLAAKSVNKKIKTIAHGHFTKPYNDEGIIGVKELVFGSIYRFFMRILLVLLCDKKVACSEMSGYYLFGKTVFKKYGIVINNGIDTKKFEFNSIIRSEVRNELGISDETIVIGHIGLMNGIKNQGFLIKVFSEFYKQNKNSLLLLVGDGPKLEDFKGIANSLPCKDSIKFLGNRSDPERLYQAFDCFVFPSVHEGFPITLIEAQASKLSCVVSDSVTNSCKINENYCSLSLNDDISSWITNIVNMVSFDRKTISIDNLIKSFEIKNVVKVFENIYES